MNMQEAGDHAEELLDRTFKAVRPPVETMRGPSSDPICTDFRGDTTGTGRIARRRYVTTIISAARRGSFLGVIERAWKKYGYEITAVRNHPEMPAIYASTPEGFQIRVQFGDGGQAQFVVDSPCVTRSQVTEAPRTPCDPRYAEAEGLPFVHSAFWSAKSPVPLHPRPRSLR